VRGNCVSRENLLGLVEIGKESPEWHTGRARGSKPQWR
jgi:hypothetical protein